MWSQRLGKHEHRHYPMPGGPWVIRMTCSDVLFMHWPMPTDLLRPLVAPGLEIDTFDDMAWLSIVPLHMANVSARFLPALPGISSFPELNVRTYVTLDGKPGVWFFSLDVPRVLPVIGGRLLFHLPYVRANMHMERIGGTVSFRGIRRDPFFASAQFRAAYQPFGVPQPAPTNSLDAWLVERYCLYAAGRQGRLFRAEIHHQPWPLQPVEAHIDVNTMAHAAGIALPCTAPVVHYAARLDMIGWAPERIG